MTKTEPRLKAGFVPGEWGYICCECDVHVGPIFVSLTYQCEACNNTNLRFTHTLEHTSTKRQIQVGIECARVLMDDYDLPTLAENETKRKERWRRDKCRKPGRCYTTIADLIERGKL